MLLQKIINIQIDAIFHPNSATIYVDSKSLAA